MENCTLSGGNFGIHLSNQLNNNDFLLAENWIDEAAVGLRINFAEAQLKCNAFSDCGRGIEIRGGNVFMQNTGGSGFGGNNFRTCSTAVFAYSDAYTYNSFFYFSGGFNNFRTISRAIDGTVAGTAHSGCKIAANSNYWNNPVLGGQVSTTDALLSMSGCSNGISFTDGNAKTVTPYPYPSNICPNGGGGPASGPAPDTSQTGDIKALPEALVVLEEAIIQADAARGLDYADLAMVDSLYRAAKESVADEINSIDSTMPYNVEVLLGLTKNLIIAGEGKASVIRHQAMSDAIALHAQYRQFDSALAEISRARKWADSSAYAMLDY